MPPGTRFTSPENGELHSVITTQDRQRVAAELAAVLAAQDQPGAGEYGALVEVEFVADLTEEDILFIGRRLNS